MRRFVILFVISFSTLGGLLYAEPIVENPNSILTNTVVISFLGNLGEGFQNNILSENRYLLILEGLKTTISIAVLAVLLGTILGSISCWMRLSKNKFLQLLAKIYVSILRGTPVLVLLMIIFYVVFASVNIEPLWVAVIAFGLNFGAYSSEIFRNGLASVQTGQHEASIALGFSKFQTFWHIVLPQAIRRILPVLKGEIITLVKMTSVVGYIAVQDLTKAGDIIRSRTFDAFFPLVMVAILYFAISWSLIFAIEFIEKKTDRRLRKRRAKR